MSIINPKEIVEKNLIENLDGGNFEVQQNGIDITLESVQIINGGTLGKSNRSVDEYDHLTEDEDGYFTLIPGLAYAIEFQQKIEVPDDMCAQIVQRSTLNRMGGYILSGVYDSGFKNTIGAVLRTNAEIKIEKGARVAQVVFSKADPASLYQGIYQGK